jgi:hypothetical protein
MKLPFLALSLGIAATATWGAQDLKALQLKPKTAIAAAPAHANAVFVMPSAEAQIHFQPLQPRDLRHDEARPGCNADRALCYDSNSGRIVYKAARGYMPSIPGLQPQDVSIRRDRIVFRYAF